MKKIVFLIWGVACMQVGSAQASSLLEIYQKASLNDSKIQKAHSDMLALLEQKNEARANLLPQLSIDGSYASGRYVDAGQGAYQLNSFKENRVATIGLGLHQEVFNLKAWTNLSMQQKVAEQARVGFKIAQQDLLVRVTEAYINILKKVDHLTIIQAEKKAIRSHLNQTNEQYKVGLVTVIDTNSAQAEFDRIVAEEIEAKNQLVNSQEILYVMTDFYPDQLNKLNTRKLVTSNQKNVSSLLKQAEKNNLMLIYNRMLTELAKQQIQLAKTDFYPTVNIQANIKHQHLGTDNPVHPLYNNGKKDRAGVSVNLSMPVFSGGKTVAQVHKQKHAYMSSSANYKIAYKEVARSIRSAANSQNSLVSAIKAYNQYVISAKSALDATQSGYNVGTNTITDVLDRVKTVYTAERKLSDARYDYILLQIRLKQLDGSLVDTDLRALNELLTIPVKLASFY